MNRHMNAFQKTTPALAFGLLALFVCLAAAGCGDKEPEQRAAFVKVLEENALARPAGRVKALSEEQAKAIGPYVEHFTLLIKPQGDSKELDEALNADTSMLRQVLGVKDLEKFKPLYENFVQSVDTAQKALKGILSNADAKKQTLKMPDDLKPLYDKAYEKHVSALLRSAIDMIDKAKSLGESAAAIIDFVMDNPDGVSLEDGKILIKKQEAQDALQKLLDAMDEKVRDFNQSNETWNNNRQ